MRDPIKLIMSKICKLLVLDEKTLPVTIRLQEKELKHFFSCVALNSIKDTVQAALKTPQRAFVIGSKQHEERLRPAECVRGNFDSTKPHFFL